MGSAYDDLTAYWSQVSTALGISPGQGLIGDWRLDYGDGGAVRYLRLVVYADRGAGQHDLYSINQERTGKATWQRSQLKQGTPVIAVPAQQFFTELSAVGYRQLESRQAISPPVRSSFSTSFGTVSYSAATHTHTMQGGRLLPAGSAGITMRGIHGMFYMTRDVFSESSATAAAYPGVSPPIYLMPAVGCSPESPKGDEGAETWVCPGAE